ncbi:MAG: DEAD/DEAH box helicase family protein [Tenacibaculum sp.]|nr:DEAD/DEAH box helicase family protein [Tenacibaculum sp.]
MNNLLNQNNIPRIYAYSDERFKGCLKVGYTTRTAEERVKEQYPVNTPYQSWKIEHEELALRKDDSFFTDHEIHRRLKKMGFEQIRDEKGVLTEFFRCSLDEVKNAILSERKNKDFEISRVNDFKMRPEQEEAVNKTAHYFKSFEREDDNIIPHFLWNAKMRFGKTFASYQLAQKMQWKKVLVLTFKPAVRSSWREDLQSHIDFQGWQFVSQDEDDKSEKDIDRNRPFVYFGSFQDVLGKDKKTGGIKIKNEWIHAENWDCVIFDEYHFGAWREKSKDLFGKNEADLKELMKQEIEEQKELAKESGEDYVDYFDEDLIPITTDHYLYLSGTPFRAISVGEFIEEQIFNWTYSDEQKAKEEWNDKNGKNPYLSLPKMVMLTYQLPQNIQQVAIKGEFNEFDLNEFFKANGKGKNAKFKYENEVQSWLDFIRGQYWVEQDLKSNKKAPMPFSDARLIHSLQHTFWFLPNVASCYAMGNLLAKNTYFNDYKIVVSAGTQAGIGEQALPPVRNAMGNNSLETKTITLSCGKLTTGVTVKEWSGVFMLRNTQSPETYFQTVFRVQSPWTIKNPDKTSPNREEIIKEQCYVFDFAPNRALSQIATYSSQLNANPNENKSPEQKVAEFIKFLPILAYDGSVMTEIDAGKLLDIAMSGTTATLLARRWESALLVNVDNVTLQRLMANEKAMKALMSIEGFRSLNSEIETIVGKPATEINKPKGECIKCKQKPCVCAKPPRICPKCKEQKPCKCKEEKSLRKKIQEKLIKFATRIPVFMYLSEYREQTLKDVITQLEPDLFKKVTGLSVADFELLEKIGVFNGALMNDAVFKFKRYEDASLSYTGIATYDNLPQVGLFDTTVTSEEYEEMK